MRNHYSRIGLNRWPGSKLRISEKNTFYSSAAFRAFGAEMVKTLQHALVFVAYAKHDFNQLRQKTPDRIANASQVYIGCFSQLYLGLAPAT